MVGKSHHLQLLRNYFYPQTSVGSVDQFPDAPLSKYTQWSQWRWHGTHESGERVNGGRGCRAWPWKSPPGGVVEGQQGAPTVHKACLVWDKRQAPGGPYGTIFTIRASLFSLGLRAWACQENSMLAGLEVVLGSNVKGERRSPTGWASGLRGSST